MAGVYWLDLLALSPAASTIVCDHADQMDAHLFYAPPVGVQMVCVDGSVTVATRVALPQYWCLTNST